MNQSNNKTETEKEIFRRLILNNRQAFLLIMWQMIGYIIIGINGVLLATVTFVLVIPIIIYILERINVATDPEHLTVNDIYNMNQEQEKKYKLRINLEFMLDATWWLLSIGGGIYGFIQAEIFGAIIGVAAGFITGFVIGIMGLIFIRKSIKIYDKK